LTTPERPSAESTAYTVDRLARQCRGFADTEGKGYSALYEHLSRQIAGDEEMLAWLTRAADPLRVPVNLFAAVHYLVGREPESELARRYAGEPGDAWPAFRRFFDDHAAEIGELMATRTIQTNEVGRSAVLVPALWHTASRFAGRPIALIEVGPSAGLNLLLDRYCVAYSDGRVTGDPSSEVSLRCEVVGVSPPLPDGSGIPIASRAGIDLAPVDVRDPDSVAWLEACIWPDVPGRLERFRAAARLAAADPPELLRGDALELLPTVIDRVPPGQVPVVFATWALAYFSRDGRAALRSELADVATRRDVALVTAEYPQVTPWLPEPPTPPPTGKAATLLATTTWNDGTELARPLAWTHAHGQWLDWFEEPG
jgi:hypothetical protein